MTLNANKFESNYSRPSNTAQRGVEAKEHELVNTNLELDMSVSTHFPPESSAASAGGTGDAAPAQHVSNDETGSYLQVVVEKHRRKRPLQAVAAQTSPRLPIASSPLTHQGGRGDGAEGGGGGGVYVVPRPVVLACSAGSPLCAALQPHSYYTKRVLVDTGTSASREPTAAAPHSPGATPPAALPHQKKNKTWKLFQDMGTDKLCDSEPDRVEVYYFEHGSCEFLATCGGGGGRPTVVERAARRSSRLAASLLAELLAAPQLALALPVALALQVARCVLVGVRGAAAGLVQTMSDYALKPALALAFNALLQPLLVFAANVSRGLRAALRPLAAALADVLEPAARLLAAVRLVDVHVACAPRA